MIIRNINGPLLHKDWNPTGVVDECADCGYPVEQVTVTLYQKLSEHGDKDTPVFAWMGEFRCKHSLFHRVAVSN